MLSLMDTAMELLREDKMKIKNMLIIACSCFLMAGCTQTGTDAIDTMENQAGGRECLPWDGPSCGREELGHRYAVRRHGGPANGDDFLWRRLQII